VAIAWTGFEGCAGFGAIVDSKKCIRHLFILCTHMILDYSQFIKHYGSYGLNSSRENNRELFFEKRGFCSFCKCSIEAVHANSLVDISTLEGAEWHKAENVWECEKCGWWEYYFYSYINGEEDWGLKDWELTVNSAILREFEIGSSSIPIEILRDYVSKNEDDIFHIHHKKMEELVASIFRNHYDCEVKVVGKSNDGGVDLILINSDEPTIVQVKRRMNRRKTESVKEIRDLIGATLLADSRKCIFVTTSDHFSESAIKSRNYALTKSIVDSFELYDFSSFMSILNLYKTDQERQWLRMLKLPENAWSHKLSELAKPVINRISLD
jgi:restriction system protein